MTSNIVWYEPRYTMLSFVSEFWNTVSGAAYVVVGLWNYNDSYSQVKSVCKSIVGIGFGTMLFHACSNWASEMVDECSMLVFGYHFMRSTLESTSISRPVTTVIQVIHSSFTALGFVIYVLNSYHPLFCGIFFINIATPAAMLLLTDEPKKNLKTSIGCMLIGKSAWLLERLIATYWLHSVWHIFSALSAHFIVRHLNVRWKAING